MKSKLIFSFILLLLCQLSFSQKGIVKGILTDKDMNNESLPFANVIVKGSTLGTTTDENGKFELNVPVGNQIITLSFIGYETIEVPVTVKANEVITINRALGAGSGMMLQDVVVETVVSREKESALLLEQKNAVEIKQAIGAQEMTRKGVSNVEQGVTKISGISKVSDRGIFVRGLDDRYNYLQINGLNFVPSDPNLKTIPLNFIPSDIVRNIDVYKTYNSELYQDFAGASINVVTKDVSSKPVSKISINSGFNTNTTFKDFKQSKGGSLDFLGYNDGYRNLPSVFDYSNPLSYQATPEESKDLFNASWNSETKSAPLNVGTNIFHSNSHALENDRKWGYVFNVNFTNSHLYQEGVRRNMNSTGFATKDFQRTVYNYNTQTSFLGGFNLKKSNKYNFDFNLIYLHNSNNVTDEVRGDNQDFITTNRPFFLRDSKFEENLTTALQHLGTFYFDGRNKKLSYGISVSQGKNDLPDRKILITEGEGANSEYITFNGADPFRYFSQLENFNVNGKVDYEIKWNEKDNYHTNNLKFGYAFDYLNYDFNQKTVRVFGGSNLTNTSIDTDNPQAFFDNAFNNSALNYLSTPDPTYNIKIAQIINAGFVNYTFTNEKFVLNAGTRVEYFFKETRFRPEDASVNSKMEKDNYNVLDLSPLINLKYALSDKNNLRLTTSKTSSKARLREGLPFRYSDGDGNFSFGNPNLENTVNYNLDVKFEKFADSGLYFSSSLFGKYIDNPISRLVEPTSTGFLTKYENLEHATLYGIELETSFGFDAFFPESTVAKKFIFGLNTILMKSEEVASREKLPFLNNLTRSLQGSSDFIINTDLAYQIADNDKVESKVNLIFSTFTERIFQIGVQTNDVKEQPINMLDFTWRNTFSKKYQVNFSIKNILDEDNVRLQSADANLISNPATYSNVSQSLTLGTTFGLEFTYVF